MVTALTTLYKHDLAACDVYKDVLKSVEDASIKSKIEGFLKDHERHIQDFERVIEKKQGEKPSDWRDLKGVLLDLYTQLRSITGQTGALKALQTAEGIILKNYKNQNLEGFDDDIVNLIMKNTEDEERHNKYLMSLDL